MIEIKPGQNVLIKDICEAHYVGKLVRIDGPFVTITNVAWIANTGRYHVFMSQGKTNDMEIEVFPPNVEHRAGPCTFVRAWPFPLFTESV